MANSASVAAASALSSGYPFVSRLPEGTTVGVYKWTIFSVGTFSTPPYISMLMGFI